MKPLLLTGLLIMTSISTVHAGKTALVIHGGAGVMSRQSMSAETETAYQAALNKALDAGNAVLQKGGTAREANCRTARPQPA